MEHFLYCLYFSSMYASKLAPLRPVFALSSAICLKKIGNICGQAVALGKVNVNSY